MQREIKFRAYAQADKTWHYWDVYGEYPDGIYGGLSEPQQYTGLKDKNGLEIYEGDILSFPKDYMEDYIVHAVVKYGTGEFDGGTYKYTGFYLESTGDDVNLKEGDIMEPYEITNLHEPLMGYHYEVVGNIFEGVESYYIIEEEIISVRTFLVEGKNQKEALEAYKRGEFEFLSNVPEEISRSNPKARRAKAEDKETEGFEKTVHYLNMGTQAPTPPPKTKRKPKRRK